MDKKALPSLKLWKAKGVIIMLEAVRSINGMTDAVSEPESPEIQIRNILFQARKEVKCVIRQTAGERVGARVYLPNLEHFGSMKLGATYDIVTGDLSFDGAVRPAEPQVVLANVGKILEAVRRV